MRVLVVDDDEDVGHMLTVMLGQRGHSVDVVKSGFGTTNRLAGRGFERPDVVVLDYMMPGLDGGQLLKMWAADPDAVKVQVLLYSAADLTVLMRAAKQHPRCTPVQKSMGLRNVVETVDGLKPDAPKTPPP